MFECFYSCTIVSASDDVPFFDLERVTERREDRKQDRKHLHILDSHVFFFLYNMNNNESWIVPTLSLSLSLSLSCGGGEYEIFWI